MSWNSFSIQVIYDDGNDTPIENAYVHVRFKNSNDIFMTEYNSGYTDSNGILTITSTLETTNAVKIVCRCIDENKCLQEGDITLTIGTPYKFTFYVDPDGPGIKYSHFFAVYDALLSAINNFAVEKLVMPKEIRLYTKNIDNTYELYTTYNDSIINFNNYFKTTELKLEVYRQNGNLCNTSYIPYKTAMFGGGGGPFICDDYYDIKLPIVNDTINWNSQNTLKGSNFEIILTYSSAYSLTQTITGTSYDTYIRADFTSYFGGQGVAPFYNLTNPNLNTMTVTKNHYLPFSENVSVSADTDGNYLFLVDGYEENEPVILEREPNVCMVNKDLFDYVVSLTEFRPNLSEGYESNRVGVSDTWFTYLWSDSIKRYLDPEYQTINPDTVDDFKTVFVNQLCTTRVLTLYTKPSSIENNYTLDKHHGYVWDRCFIPEEKEFVENCLTFSIGQNDSCDISFNYIPGIRTIYDFEYSTNNGVTWNSYSFTQNGNGEIISLSNGGNTSVKFRRALSNTGTTLSSGYDNYYYFAMEGTCMATGSITSLLDAYGLSTTELDSDFCFVCLFNNCNGLLTPPELPSTTLSDYCYSNMFRGCTSLTTVPELPAMTLAQGCYSGMFDGCTSLTTAPELPAMTLANYCYEAMFSACTSLITAPELPATTLAEGCYNAMFHGCTSLTTAPELSATTLAYYCYSSMFAGCTSLTTAPELPTTTLQEGCYNAIFQGCTSLTTAPELPATTLATYCYSQMFEGCTSLRTAPELPATTLASHCYNAMFYGCTSLTTAPDLPATTLAGSCYCGMFQNCTSLRTAPILSATTLANECCQQMFFGCSSLTGSPLLRATRLTNSCYKEMFYGCTSLTNARTLSAATVLEESCFENMFGGCAALVTSPTISSSPGMKKNCFKNMFNGCSNLTTMPYTGTSFPWQSHAYGCYEGMFANCTSLRTIPSTIFGYNAYDYCFRRMFAGCTRITTKIRLYANNLGSLSGVCESMFEGCTNLMSGLTADSLIIGPDCYKNMFKNCGNLSCIEAKFTGTTSGNFTMQNASGYTNNWVYGVSSAGVFYHKSATPEAPTGYSVHWIPNGWEVQLLA